MGKKAVTIYKWILVAVILQVLVLCYVEFFYLGNFGGVRATTYEPEETSLSDKEISLPGDAEGIKVSSDGKRVAYLTGGKLELVDIKNHNRRKTLTREGWELTEYDWLPDRGMIICSYARDGKTSSIQLSTYDMESDVERSYPELKGLTQGSRTTDIKLSPFTNIVYFKISVSGSKARIYRFNIMDNAKYVMSVKSDSEIGETLYYDYFIYENNNTVYIRDGKTKKSNRIPVKGSFDLLGTDAEDKVYAGQLNDKGKITTVYFGSIDKPESSNWEHTTLKAPLDPERIRVSLDGGVYEVDEKGNTVYDVVTGQKKTYKGEFIDILENYLVVKDGKHLKLIVF